MSAKSTRKYIVFDQNTSDDTGKLFMANVKYAITNEDGEYIYVCGSKFLRSDISVISDTDYVKA